MTNTTGVQGSKIILEMIQFLNLFLILLPWTLVLFVTAKYGREMPIKAKQPVFSPTRFGLIQICKIILSENVSKCKITENNIYKAI